MSLKQTPLYKDHLKLGGRMVNFGGWSLPVQYTSIIKEHEAVRQGVGVFDTSHMGEIFVSGEDTTRFIDYLITNDYGNLPKNKCLYSPMCYANGTVVDDVIVYKWSVGQALVVVNAANINKDVEWMSQIISDKKYAVKLLNKSNDYSMLAVQGPKAPALISSLLPNINDLKAFSFIEFSFEVDSIKSRLGQLEFKKELVIPGIFSTTGYTGEKGGEFYIKNSYASALMNILITLGATPCGLGARDSLRLEKGYSLYGHELSDSLNVIDVGLKWTVKLDKTDFIGKPRLQKYTPLKKLVGFIMEERVVARQGAKVWGGEQVVGEVTSGSFSPSLKKNIGLALVSKDCLNQQLYIEVRGKKQRIQTTNRQFV